MSNMTTGRVKPARVRSGRTYEFTFGTLTGTLTVNELPDGRPGEIFMTAAKQGSTMSGFCETLSIMISLALQHGASVKDIARRLVDARFEPAGYTGDPEVPFAASLSDYLARRLAVDYLSDAELHQLNIIHRGARLAMR